MISISLFSVLNLPIGRSDREDEMVWALVQDHVRPGLLFAGTERGLYFTVDEGTNWIRLKGGLPTIQVRDLDIQREWNDLAVETLDHDGIPT